MKFKVSREGALALAAIGSIVSQGPQPEAASEVARRCAESISRHLDFLIVAASHANYAGQHSVPLALFRSMEDALDCLAAVCLVPGAAEKWANGKMKASQAARIWESRLGDVTLSTGEKAVDYRKTLRSYFNNFAHCTPYLTDWNLHFEVDPDDVDAIARNPDQTRSLSVQLQVNHEQVMLTKNALRINAYLAAHTLEFVSVVEMGYETFLDQHEELRARLSGAKDQLDEYLRENIGAVYLEDRPPELQNVVIEHPTDADKMLILPSPFDEQRQSA